ncbi:MAG: potassium channel family protein [Candidatus Binataceae bacterium]
MPSDMKGLGPITYAIERTFWAAQYVSPPNLLFRTRVQIHDEIQDAEQHVREAITASRAVKIDACIVAWLVVEIATAIAVWRHPSIWRFLLFFPVFRLFEILQAAVNLNLFDRVRMRGEVDTVSSITRTLVLSLWNFFEVMLCFGILYSLPPIRFRGNISGFDAYYFSAVTQLTIGYGDIQPLGVAKLFVVVQGCFAFMLALIALSRFVSLLPKAGAVFSA